MDKEVLKISYVILTWNSEKFIEKCLTSLSVGANGLNYEVIIVDNGSKDNTLKLVAQFCPNATIIKNNLNRGVAPARNHGILLASGEYIVVLDIDTELCYQSISKMVLYMQKNREIGLCAPKSFTIDGYIHESARKFPTVFSKILRRIDSKWAEKLRKNELYNLKEISKPIEVDYAVGACQVIRSKAMEQVGLLDSKIFYGPEDIDYCLRMWMKGWKVVYYPMAEIMHYEQRITKKKLISKITLLHITGLIHYFIKYRYAFSRKKLYKNISSIKTRIHNFII